MRTKKEIKTALKNLETVPEKTGWGCGGYDVSDYIEALEWVLNKTMGSFGKTEKSLKAKSKQISNDFGNIQE